MISSFAGANIVDIESEKENIFISSLMTNDTWTGGLLEIESDTWHWEGGATWTWSGWSGTAKGKPRYGCLKVLTGTVDRVSQNKSLYKMEFSCDILYSILSYRV